MRVVVLCIVLLLPLPFARAQGFRFVRIESGTTHPLYRLSFATPELGFALGEAWDSSLLKTTDGGNHWAPFLSSPSKYVGAINILPSGKGWLLAYGDSIYKTSDFGETWKFLYAFALQQTDDGVFDLDFADSLFGLATASFAYWRTSDGGLTWIWETNSRQYMQQIDHSTAKHWIVQSSYTQINDGRDQWMSHCMVSHDTGKTWINPNDGGHEFDGVQALDSDFFFAVGTSHQLARSTDGGATWHNQLYGGDYLAAVRMHDRRNGLVVGTEPGGGVIRQTWDSGATWVRDTLLPTVLFDVKYLDSDRCIVVGEKGTILLGSLTAVGVSKSRSAPTVYTYPNPTFGDITIEFSGLKGQNLEIELVDVLGKRLISKFNSPSKIHLPTFGLSKGLVLYRVSGAGLPNRTGKVILQ